MKIVINGKAKDIEDNIKNLRQCIELTQKDTSGLITELNGKIIKKGDRENILLKDGDKIELIQFMGGG